MIGGYSSNFDSCGNVSNIEVCVSKAFGIMLFVEEYLFHGHQHTKISMDHASKAHDGHKVTVRNLEVT